MYNLLGTITFCGMYIISSWSMVLLVKIYIAGFWIWWDIWMELNRQYLGHGLLFHCSTLPTTTTIICIFTRRESSAKSPLKSTLYTLLLNHIMYVLEKCDYILIPKIIIKIIFFKEVLIYIFYSENYKKILILIMKPKLVKLSKKIQ